MKKIVISAAVAAAVVFGVFQANQNNNQLSDLQLENVEALAQSEDTTNPCKDTGVAIYVVPTPLDDVIAGRDCLCKEIAIKEILMLCNGQKF